MKQNREFEADLSVLFSQERASHCRMIGSHVLQKNSGILDAELIDQFQWRHPVRLTLMVPYFITFYGFLRMNLSLGLTLLTFEK